MNSDKDKTTISMEARVMRLLAQSETEDLKPPYRALPTEHLQWRRIKAQKILAMLDERDKALYQATNKLMIKLGADGEVDTRDIEVENVMNALHDIDGGAATKEEG